jgi:hypothetical protein
MRHLIIYITLISLPFALNGQTLKGKIYNTTTTVKNIKVLNKTQNRFTVSNSNGDFSIGAEVNDSIVFQSLFYHPKVVVLKPIDFEGIAVFELEEIISELDEVEVKAEVEQPVFEEKTYNIELQNLIKEDIKNHPEKYQPAGATYGVDFIYLIGQVAKLFKNKDKYRAPAYQPISYKQLDSLFKTSSFFNKELMTKNLNIPEDKANLFYDFCEAKQISSELLQEKKKMDLLENLVLNSQLFLILIEEYGEKSVKKD